MALTGAAGFQGEPPDEQRCTAKAKTTGDRCKQWRVRGFQVCGFHGAGRKKKGKPVPQQRELVDKREKARATAMEVHARAERMAARAGTDAHPIEHLLDSLHRAAAMVAIYGVMVADLDHTGEVEAEGVVGRQRGWSERGWEQDPEGKPRVKIDMDPLLVQTTDKTIQLHPYVAEYRHWISERAKLAKLALDAGIDQRRIQLDERRAVEAVEAIGRAIDRVALNDGEKSALRQEIAEEFRSLQRQEV